ncbi:toll-like receptor 2 [Mugil cephalus]|uniref:toll-like receptor 2 n=1 Tax=Mugil cephalus TaxID=48193 RepID=UPI001FB6EC84|nr:toll-like receptor 2 [Mugil cephalus]
MAFLVFVLLVLQSVSVCRPQCPRCEQTSCNCSRLNLTEVPASPTELVSELDLSFNGLEEIKNDDFLSYATLRSLIMSYCNIRTIQRKAFDPLIHLEKLDLSFNQLDTLSPGWFENLTSLQYLNLLGNKYTTLGEGELFEPLKKLKTLHLGGPFFHSLNKSDFSSLFHLEDLFLDGRNLKVYANESLTTKLSPISHVTLGLNDAFHSDPSLAQAILSDFTHPNTMLTLRDTFFSFVAHTLLLKSACDNGITGIYFKNVTMSSIASIGLLHVVSSSAITMVGIEDTQLLEFNYLEGWEEDPDGVALFLNFLSSHSDGLPESLGQLEAVIVKNVDITWFYRFPSLNFLYVVFKVVRRVSVLNSKLFAIPCETTTAILSSLEFLDISDNILSDLALSDMMCDGAGVLLNLHTVNVSRNLLQSFNSHLFTKLDQLENIDMSGNMFQDMPETCDWPPSLLFLNLSSNHLKKVTACLPTTLQILDLSGNDLTEFTIELPFLTELHISGNRIRALPDGHFYPRLALLSIQNNDLRTFSSKDVHDYKTLKSLEAGASAYICSCDFVAFMTSDPTNHGVLFEDGLTSYICGSPDAERGKSVADVRLSVFECHAVIAFSLLCTGILVTCLLISGLCYKFGVLWYMRMTWAWLRAKRKPKLKKGVLEYDAFVSYSEMDSGWVEAHLVPALERSEPPLQLCLHKRDFVPGGWILDNIMDAIDKSHRTLFILSQHFIKSEWCKYELDYTHFRLFDQNDDTIVLILLEPVDKAIIPKRFCRLRRIMNSRTYLEWPGDEDQIPAFWESLRTAIKRPETFNGKHANGNETQL